MANKEVQIHPDKNSFKNPQQVMLGEADSEMWVNNVFGVNKEGTLPARFLTGFGATFGLAETISERTKGRIVPKVRIFIPSNISQGINKIDPEIIARQVTQGKDLLEQMARAHYPHVSLFFEQDVDFTDSAKALLRDVVDLSLPHCEEDLIDRLRANGSRRVAADPNGTSSNQEDSDSELYWGHHSFGWSDKFSPLIFEQKPPFTVINTMPPSEKPYARFREIAKEQVQRSPDHRALLAPGRRFDFYMMMCERPHYLLITDREREPIEPTLDQLGSVPVGEILDFFAQRQIGEEAPWVRNNLRRAHADFLLMLNKFSKGRIEEARKASFNELLQGGMK